MRLKINLNISKKNPTSISLLPSSDETLEALSDAQVVAPAALTVDLHSVDHRNSFLYVFDYQTKFGDYPQVTVVRSEIDMLDVCLQFARMENRFWHRVFYRNEPKNKFSNYSSKLQTTKCASWATELLVELISSNEISNYRRSFISTAYLYLMLTDFNVPSC